MMCDRVHWHGTRARAIQGTLCRELRVVPLLALLAWSLTGCALLQPPAPPPTTADCAPQEREIVRLQQTLAEKDAEVQRLRAQQNMQAKVLKQTAGEVARAEVKLRRLATQAGAASQLAEAEVALQALRAQAHPQRTAAQLAQAQHILDAGAAAFAQGDYGAAVELAARSQEIVEMLASGRRGALPAARDVVEVPFQVPVALRARIDSNLRARPERTASVVGVLSKDTSVNAHAYRGNWLHVRTEDGREGWVLGALLEAPQPSLE